MSTTVVRTRGKASTVNPETKSPVVYGPARVRREIQWGLRATPSPAERRRGGLGGLGRQASPSLAPIQGRAGVDSGLRQNDGREAKVMEWGLR